MVLVISQETFDEAVRENIEDLGLSPEEALTEAVNQFKSQGVDLSQVITQKDAGSSSESIKSSLAKLTDVNKTPTSTESVEQLLLLKQELDKGIQYKIQAGKAGAYPALLALIHNGDAEVKMTSLKVMISLMTKQPDLLDDKGVQVIVTNLGPGLDVETQRLILRWARECCVMHEKNRQTLVDAHIVEKLSANLKENQSPILKEVLGVFRALVFDDDVRVEFGKAHEHARIIAAEALEPITQLLKNLKLEEFLVHDLMSTLSALLVRAEFCQVVEEKGGLDIIQHVMTAFVTNEKIVRQGFNLIKALSGNDECKALLIQKGLAPVIVNALNTHKISVQTATAGLGCIAALTLRNPENSKAIFDAGGPEVIIDTMRKHPNEKQVQKSASWAIRNMVSRSRYQNKEFLELGVEEVLKSNLAKFKEFEYDIKAALRDLDCTVDLKEEWTGKGGQINSDAFKKNKA